MTDQTESESESESASPAQWTPAVTEPPAEFPDGVTAADGPFAWTNDNTGRGLRIEHNDTTEQLDDWIVTGETVRIEPRLLATAANECVFIAIGTAIYPRTEGFLISHRQWLAANSGLQPVRKAD
jgi:hypothetical protein